MTPLETPERPPLRGGVHHIETEFATRVRMMIAYVARQEARQAVILRIKREGKVFNGDALRERSAQILTLAEEQGTIVPLMVGHRLMAMSLLHTGDIAAARAHFDRAIALYDRVEHRPLATRFGQDVRVAILSFRSQAVWVLGHPEAAMADADQAVSYAREIRQAGTLMYALGVTSLTHVNCRNYATASALEDELTALVDETDALHWKGSGMSVRGWLLALSGKASDAVHMIIAGVTSYGSRHSYSPSNAKFR